MTRKDYIRLARALAFCRPPEEAKYTEYHTWKKTVDALCIELRLENERFDTDRFVDACHA